MKNIDEILKEKIKPDEIPNDVLNAKLLNRAKDDLFMKNKKIQTKVAVACFTCALAMGSVSAYAAYRLLSPAQVASEISEDGNLEKAFKSESATVINETQNTGGYNVTLLGTVTGKDLMPYYSDSISDNKTYAVVAIENEDGSPISADEHICCVTPLINGKSFMELSVADFDGGIVSFTENGVLYELLVCDDLEIFSEIGVSIGVTKDYGDGTCAFSFDEATGLHSRNMDYNGMNALFELPLDKSKADNDAAEKFFEKAAEERNLSANTGDEDTAYFYDEESGLPLYKEPVDTMAGETSIAKEQNFFYNIFSFMLTEEQIEKLKSYGSIYASDKFSEQDGMYHVVFDTDIIESDCLEAADNYDEGTPCFYFSGGGDDCLFATYSIKENGVLTEEILVYDLDQIHEMYEEFH